MSDGPGTTASTATWPLPGGTTLRRARRSDLAQVVALLADDVLGAGRESGDGDLAAYEAAFEAVDADPAHLLVVACRETDTEVLGTLQLSIIPGLSRRGSLRGQVEGVRVHDRERGTGLGGAMIGWAVDEARRRGCALVQLTTDKQRVDAHRFYERLGFVASHEGYKLTL